MKIIVSVTTTKARFDIFFYGLQSLKRKNHDNYFIFVNIPHEKYLHNEGIDLIQDWISGENIRVNFVQKNTGSYRKLVPTLDALDEEDIVITADDDVLYSEW